MSYWATKKKGKGLLVGSGLTPPLTNLYLMPLDKYLERRKLEFVRYGDDLLVFCLSAKKAKEILRKVREKIRGLRQKTNTKSAFDAARCWPAALRLRWNIGNNVEAAYWAYGRGRKLKTDIYEPGEPFDFIGFEFDGDRIHIRQETVAKAKSRLQQYTQRSLRMIQKSLRRGDRPWGMLVHHGGEEIAVASIHYAHSAIRRVNLFLGFKTSQYPRGSKPRKVTFYPGFGFPWNILNCAKSDEIQQQFKLLDAYLLYRLLRLTQSVLGDLSRDYGTLYDFRKFGFRAEGMMTFKDVLNRFPARTGSPSS